MQYGQLIRPYIWKVGRLAVLIKANREAIFKLLFYNSWKYLNKI